MLGEKTLKDLEYIKKAYSFSKGELEVITFIENNRRLPNYVDNRRLYNIYLRLKKKLRKANETRLILSKLFETLETIKVSNKLIGGGVD